MSGVTAPWRWQHIVAAVMAVGALAGCGSMPSWSIPAPSLDWITGRGDASKPGPLPELVPTATATVAWQVKIGRSQPGLSPAITADAIYAAASDGALVRIDPQTGRTVWRISAGKPLAAGPGADGSLVVVATDKGDVLAFDPDGKPMWTSRVSSEVSAPPAVAEGVVVVSSGDGRIYGLNSADGKTKWVNQRINPPLTIRNHAGGVVSRGGIFLGLPGGRLLAMDLQTGSVGWDCAVATPKGATELERIADVTSRPVVEERHACAVAFQGRLACFELLRGTLQWTRDVSSLTGIASDIAAFYVVDESGALHAFDRSTGASLWKQDSIAGRKPRGAQVVGTHVGVIDVAGYLHLFTQATGVYVGRLATDGSAPTGQPHRFGERMVWQSLAGTVYAVDSR